MPHASLKLLPGVDQNRTPTLNEAAISSSQLLRFFPDKGGIALPQKLGGWVKYYANPIGSPIRCLWGWTDLNQASHLGVGAEESLTVITAGSARVITPRMDVRDAAVDVETTAGSNEITITDIASDITNYDSVFIETQISIGGLILFGLYQCYQVSADTYIIYTFDQLGNPLPAPASSSSGAVPAFEATSGASLVVVTLADHGLIIGNTFPVLVSTSFDGITLFGNYSVFSVTDADTFTIQASSAASSTSGSPVEENGGDARYRYYISVGPLVSGSGYGANGYGEGGYGSGISIVPNPGTPILAEDWSLANWGQILIANPLGGALYAWDPTTNAETASVLSNGPDVNYGFFVAMPQRQIIAYGSTFNGIIDPLLIRWCDIQNYGKWLATVTNQAGSYRLPRGSKIVGGIQAPQQGLIWTDLGVWSMQYINQPLIYGFNELASGCGLIAQKAVGVLNSQVFWMSQTQFFQMTGSGVAPLFCPVWDVVFQDLDTDNLQKIRCAANSRFGEITWYFPTLSSNGEVSAYVKYNANIQQWDYGTLARTAWIDQSVLGAPIGAAPNEFIYQHEMSNDADGMPLVSSFRTGYFALAEGDNMVFVDQVWPDMKWGTFGAVASAEIQITFYVTDYPGDTPRIDGPHSVTQSTQFITPRIRGRLVAIEIGSSDIGSWWRLGNLRYRYQPDGKF